MNYKQPNEILANLNNPKEGLTLMSTNESADYYEEKNQGDEGLKVEIFAVDADPEIFLKIVKATDSYGDNEHITSIQFVTKLTKTIDTYEPVQ
jgi:hypothetical protein